MLYVHQRRSKYIGSFKNICSHKRDDDLVRHEDVDTNVDKEAERSAGLGDDEQVDDGVQDAGSHKQSVAEEGSGVGGVGEHVEEAEDQEGENVLHVVQVSSPHSLHILVNPGLSARLLGVLG